MPLSHSPPSRATTNVQSVLSETDDAVNQIRQQPSKHFLCDNEIIDGNQFSVPKSHFQRQRSHSTSGINSIKTKEKLSTNANKSVISDSATSSTLDATTRIATNSGKAVVDADIVHKMVNKPIEQPAVLIGMHRYINITKRKRSPVGTSANRAKINKTENASIRSNTLSGNRFAPLADANDNSSDNQPSKELKPPPIYLRERSSNALIILLFVSYLSLSNAAVSQIRSYAVPSKYQTKTNYAYSSTGRDDKILRKDIEMKNGGAYHYQYETSNGIKASEHGVGGVSVQGENSYISPEGVEIKMSYTADENGYHPVGDHIPKTPDYILRALEYIRTHPYKEEEQYKKTVNNGSRFAKPPTYFAPPTKRPAPRKLKPTPRRTRSFQTHNKFANNQ